MAHIMPVLAWNKNTGFRFYANSELNIPNSPWVKINDEDVLSKHNPHILDHAHFIWIPITNLKFTDYFGLALSDIKNSCKWLFTSSAIKRRQVGFGRVIALFTPFLLDIHIQIRPEDTQISQWNKDKGWVQWKMRTFIFSSNYWPTSWRRYWDRLISWFIV